MSKRAVSFASTFATRRRWLLSAVHYLLFYECKRTAKVSNSICQQPIDDHVVIAHGLVADEVIEVKEGA
jgi:hypothetical protein